VPSIALVALAVLARPSHASAERLLLTAFREHYDLRFAPHLGRETFDGEARTRVRVLRPTTRIVLRAAELEITSSKIIVGQRVYTANARLRRSPRRSYSRCRPRSARESPNSNWASRAF
jgi:hypothetical protein